MNITPPPSQSYELKITSSIKSNSALWTCATATLGYFCCSLARVIFVVSSWFCVKEKLGGTNWFLIHKVLIFK